MRRPRQTPPGQAELPRLRADGRTHTSACGCPRCRGWTPEGEALRRKIEEKAAAALARRRERRQARALALQLDLAEEERRTNEYLQRQAARFERLKEDHRLDLLLASREAGKPVAEAIAEVERSFSPRRAS